MIGSFIISKIRSWISSTHSFVVHNILHADDPPHRLSLGVAIAMFITFTPTIGFQMALVFFLAWLFGGNKLVGLPLVWLSNPATMVPIYYPCLWLGEYVLGKPHRNFEWFRELFREAPGDWWPKLQFFGNAFWDIAIELWVGCLLVGGVLGIVSYYFTYWCVYCYRMKLWGQITRPLAFRSSKEHPDSSGNSVESELNSDKVTPAQFPTDASGDRINSPKHFELDRDRKT